MRRLLIVCLMLFLALKTEGGSRGEAGAFSEYIPSVRSKAPIKITLDFTKERGEFSDEMFTCMDSPFVDREMNELMKESNFKVVADMERDLSPEKAKAIADYGFKSLIFYDQRKPLPKDEIERQTLDFLGRIEALNKRHSGFDVKYIIFANEPDLSPPPGGFPEGLGPFWSGTMDELFQNYAVFASYVKLKKPQILVGGLGFADAGSRVWIQRFIEYVYKNKVPLDFLPYHCYSISIKAYIDGFNFIDGLLDKYPGLSPLYGKPKIAVTELDVAATLTLVRYDYPGGWKAAHNILAMLYLADRGAWMAIDYGGPSRETAEAGSFLWLKSNGDKKPVYFAHQAFNNLAGTIQIAQEGSVFETFGAGAGKSQKGNSLVIVLASYDRYSPRVPENHRQSSEVLVYKSYALKIVNLPFNDKDTLVIERFLVDEKNKLSLAESREIQGNPQVEIIRDIGLPQVQLVKICRK